MGDKGKKDKGKKEQQKSAKLTLKGKRKQKKEKKRQRKIGIKDEPPREDTPPRPGDDTAGS